MLDTLEQLLKFIPANIYWLDIDNVYQGCNPAQASDFGLQSVDAIVGKKNSNLPVFQDYPEIINQIDKVNLEVIKSKSPRVLEEKIIKNGRDKFYLSYKAPLINDKNKIFGLLGVSIDITNFKVNEEKLIYENEQIQKAQAAVGKAESQVEGMSRVSAAMAHELRTPLASIAMGATGIEKYFQTLLEGYQLAQQHKLDVKFISKDQIDVLSQVLAHIKNEAAQANMVINMLLTNLSMQQGKQPRQKIKLSIADYVTEALNKYVFPPGKRALVHEDLANNFIFYGDETLLSHIIFNLLKNSFYFIDKTRKGEIYIWLEAKKDYNELHFKDTAQGIPEKDLPHIFEQFFTKDTHHGTGVGLAFCKAVMESWGGEIVCHSVYGEYVEFVCQFPKKTVNQTE